MSDLIRPAPRTTWRDRAEGFAGTLRPSRLLTAAGAVLLVASAAWWLLQAPSPPVEARLPMAAGAGPTGSVGSSVADQQGPASPTTAAAEVVVQAAGAVVRPGVYRLGGGARVADLVAEAGGPAADAQLDAVALASKLVDGQRVYVPKAGEPVAATDAGNASSAAAPSPEAPVDLNAASAEQLEQLPGIGPTMAAAIVAHRERHGPFRSVEGLLDVRGIGPARLDELRPLVRA